MKHVLPWLLLMGLTAGCLPDRRDGAAAGADAADDAVDDAADTTGTTSDAKGDAKDAGDAAHSDVPQLGCKKDDDCSAFADSCHTGTCDLDTGLCAIAANADGSTCVGVTDLCGTDLCQAGVCVHTPQNACDDSNACTVDLCDPLLGCPKDQTPPALIAAPANCGPSGKDPCDCDDLDACTEGDVCNGTACKPGALRSCDDKNACTTDACDPAKGCSNTAVPDTTSCGDSTLKCTTDAHCTAGVCIGKPVVCTPDKNPCNITACIEFLGGCQTAANDLAPCDDGNPCTEKDVCDGHTDPANGTCSGTPKNCDDKNDCTDDTCSPTTGCPKDQTPPLVVPVTGTCKLSGACAAIGVCNAGTCQAPAASCDDGNACTDDACDAKLGCTHTNNDKNPCNDGNACTYGDDCESGTCIGHSDVTVDDGNPCTADDCDPVSGPHWTVKSNGFGCGSGKSCVGGVCQPNTPCGDGICGVAETFGSCPGDCPSGGGQCDASDASCITTCMNTACSGELVACQQGDAGCAAISTCADACATDACTLSCLVPTSTDPSFPTSVQIWLDVQWCRSAQCVANGWLGRPCIPGGADYATCAAGCESGFCLQSSLACAIISGCPAQKNCLAACNGDTTCEAACSGDTASTAAAQALLTCSTNLCQ